ncbi:AEC family transporter [Bifidobacterium sp. 82T24]|uniref:AEC family transporter n=1 Tax=Bifidobacterium pluvialisilvae TaxID=2834436 RepID=UPI001C56AE87|nr:AEC family transporter [Bifidobacterium pluvialisilvae]MBW3088585.1 AEC family transporter [Bifidobacterium pluvialisilvae]
MSQFEIVVGQIVGFFIMMMVGYGCVRLRFYGMKTLDGMCMLLTKVLIPVLVFSNAVAGTTRADIVRNWGIIALTAIMYALLAAVVAVAAWILRLHGSRSHLFQAGFMFGNAGFIGIPLVMALFPKDGAIFIVLMSLVDQALLWSYGVWLCEPVRDAGAERVAVPFSRRAVGFLRRFANPAFIGILIALAIITAGVRIPGVILTPLHTIGQMSTPLSLFYLGGLFALTKWWGIFGKYELYVGMVIKMLLFPIGFAALMTWFAGATGLPFTHEMIEMMALISGLPTMTTIAMFSGRSKNMPEYAVGMVLVSTLFSLISLTAISAVIF